MPSLAHNHLYSRAAVLRAMQAAGQFAHLRPDEIEAEVASLYDHEWRETRDGPGVTGFQIRERAVPMVLCRAVRDGFSQECFDGEVINHIAMRLGVTCCLCLAIEEPDPHPGWTLPDGFLAAVCPTFLWIAQRGDAHKAAQPACRKCRKSLNGYFWRTHGFVGAKTDDAWDAALAWLLLNPGFRERVKANANNITRLRFDPRRAERRAAA